MKKSKIHPAQETWKEEQELRESFVKSPNKNEIGLITDSV